MCSGAFMFFYLFEGMSEWMTFQSILCRYMPSVFRHKNAGVSINVFITSRDLIYPLLRSTVYVFIHSNVHVSLTKVPSCEFTTASGYVLLSRLPIPILEI